MILAGGLYNRIFDEFPAKNTIYIYMVQANPSYGTLKSLCCPHVVHVALKDLAV
jgi:hypothetical protein